MGLFGIDDALAQLPEDYRAAVVLRDLVGMDYVSCSPYGIPVAKLTIAQMLVAITDNAHEID